MEQQTGIKELFLRLVAIVGLIAVLVLGAWGIILLAFNLVGLFTGSVHFSNLFNSKPAVVEQQATTTAPVVITQNNNGNTSNTSSNTQATKPSSTGATTAVYTAAPRTTTLYGLADLAVTITSVNSLSSVQGRNVIQFTVVNGGTNVARSGWTFNASLPYQGSTYTYQSAPQQALYPGDSIAFTLTYDDNYNQYNYNGYNNQVCSQQYPYTCTYNNQNQYYNQYQQYPYNNSGTCYTYNGYTNTPYPCDNGSQSGNANYNYYNQYSQNGYNNYNYYGNRSVSITLDPQNFIPESAEYNNSATKSF
jgi:hypothetical protein